MKVIDTLSSSLTHFCADWRVISEYYPAANREADPQPIRSLEWKRPGEVYWHTAESWREEMRRPIPSMVARWAVGHWVPAKSLARVIA